MKIRNMQWKDLAKVQKVDQAAWSDWSFKSTGKRKKFLMRSLSLLESYLDGDIKGCFVAEEEQIVVGYAFSKTFGTLGYLGPLGVHHQF